MERRDAILASGTSCCNCTLVRVNGKHVLTGESYIKAIISFCFNNMEKKLNAIVLIGLCNAVKMDLSEERQQCKHCTCFGVSVALFPFGDCAKVKRKSLLKRLEFGHSPGDATFFSECDSSAAQYMVRVVLLGQFWRPGTD